MNQPQVARSAVGENEPIVTKLITNDGALFSPERWQQLRAKLEQLMDATSSEQALLLAELEVANPDLAKDLRALLLEEPALASRVPSDFTPVIAEQIPERIGPFRLQKRIGTGGMGTVYLAEREHADFIQRVALKLLDSRSARLARLALRERRILAALKHPHITAFVDAGIEDGCAWLAMEYVEGQSLLAYCQNQRLTAKQHVQLFDQICAAVAHAHAALVVHRDLKPSNVLVDAQGNAKLLDFGIALVLDDSGVDTPATRVFTPEYAAPEQLRGERVGTACDVYSLGLLLFEMLVGQRLSANARALHAGEWQTADLLRSALTEREPQSHALHTKIQLGSNQKQPSSTRTIKTLTPLLKGDLGRIIAHCLHPEPSQRYASVALLREDLARWLDDRSISISRASTWQTFTRFARRYRYAFAISVLSFVAIAGLAIAALWQAQAKAIEAERARIALRKSEATRDFLNSVFLSADPYFGSGAATTIGEVLKQASARVDRDLAAEPEIAAALLYQIGNVYVSLGDDAASRDSLNKALRYNKKSASPSPMIEGSVRARLAMFDFKPAHPEITLAQLEAAITLLRNAGADTEAKDALARALDIQANIFYSVGNKVGCIAASTESMQIYKSLGDQQTRAYLNAAQGLADRLAAMDQYAQALPIIEEVLAHPAMQRTDQNTEQGMLLAYSQSTLGRTFTGLNRFSEASVAFDRAIASATRAVGAQKGSTRYFRFLQIQLWVKMGELERARVAVDALLGVPPTGAANPIERLAMLTTGARIRLLERSDDAVLFAQRAQLEVCGDEGHAGMCAHTLLILAELSLRATPFQAQDADAALKLCSTDAALQSDVTSARRFKLLQAQFARQTRQFAQAEALLEKLGLEELLPEEKNQLAIEAGYLALAQGQTQIGIEKLTQARAEMLRLLTKPTPQVLELEAVIKAK
jgi:eukaryotic-like serine/threonine-protein kinase